MIILIGLGCALCFMLISKCQANTLQRQTNGKHTCQHCHCDHDAILIHSLPHLVKLFPFYTSWHITVCFSCTVAVCKLNAMNHCQRQRANTQGILKLRLGSGPKTKLDTLAGGDSREHFKTKKVANYQNNTFSVKKCS